MMTRFSRQGNRSIGITSQLEYRKQAERPEQSKVLREEKRKKQRDYRNEVDNHEKSVAYRKRSAVRARNVGAVVHAQRGYILRCKTSSRT